MNWRLALLFLFWLMTVPLAWGGAAWPVMPAWAVWVLIMSGVFASWLTFVLHRDWDALAYEDSAIADAESDALDDFDRTSPE